MVKTLAIIKPDAVKKNLIGKILAQAEENGLKISALKMIHLTKKEAGDFYSVHRGKDFFDSLTDFISEGPIVAAVLEGDHAVTKWRRIMGTTDPREAGKGSIRNLYGETLSRNAVHGSDSPESAATEIAFFAKIFDRPGKID